VTELFEEPAYGCPDGDEVADAVAAADPLAVGDWKNIPPEPDDVLIEPDREALGAAVGKEEVIDIIGTAVPVGNADKEAPTGRVRQRLGRGTSRTVVTTAGLKPKVL